MLHSAADFFCWEKKWLALLFDIQRKLYGSMIWIGILGKWLLIGGHLVI